MGEVWLWEITWRHWARRQKDWRAGELTNGVGVSSSGLGVPLQHQMPK
jgi:hypothetical protein